MAENEFVGLKTPGYDYYKPEEPSPITVEIINKNKEKAFKRQLLNDVVSQILLVIHNAPEPIKEVDIYYQVDCTLTDFLEIFYFLTEKELIIYYMDDMFLHLNGYRLGKKGSDYLAVHMRKLEDIHSRPVYQETE